MRSAGTRRATKCSTTRCPRPVACEAVAPASAGANTAKRVVTWRRMLSATRSNTAAKAARGISWPGSKELTIGTLNCSVLSLGWLITTGVLLNHSSSQRRSDRMGGIATDGVEGSAGVALPIGAVLPGAGGTVPGAPGQGGCGQGIEPGPEEGVLQALSAAIGVNHGASAKPPALRKPSRRPALIGGSQRW
jgi:hypothetical protein